METCALTLTEATEKFLIRRQVDKKKYFLSYLTMAEDAWKWMYVNILYRVKTVWYPLKKGEPYNYIDYPSNCQRLLSVNEITKEGLIDPLFQNTQLNIVPKPTTKKCGCDACDCSGVCEDANSLVATTKLLFTINGTDYYEKTWTKLCPNGDILEYKEIPTKKYNDYTGNAGDFNDDFNDDFLIGDGGFSNYSIVTVKEQRKLCSLTLLPCGCPENTPENQCALEESCGCFFPFWRKDKEPNNEFLPPINSNHKGEWKISECGTKIYYKPQRHFGKTSTIPDFLQVSFQDDGTSLSEQSRIPQYALKCFWAVLDYENKQFNPRYSMAEKEESRINKTREENDLILYMNNLSLKAINNVQNIQMKW